VIFQTKLESILIGIEYFLTMINNITDCKDKVSAGKTLSAFTDIIYYKNRAKWTSACPPPCTQKSYSLDVKKYHTNSWIEYDNQPFEDVSKTAVGFSLAYETFLIEEQVETLVYDAGNFLAAIGGNLGLFRGFSCLTLLLWIFKIGKKIHWHLNFGLLS
jgi:hypothetical protein